MKKLARVPNWDVRLGHEARRLVGRPFEWGATDCGTLCRTALDALYGPGTATRLFGRPWKTARGAKGAVKRMDAILAKLEALGARRVPRAYASGGDLIIRPGTDDVDLPRLAVVVGPVVLRVTHEGGVIAEPSGSIEEDDVVLRLPGGTLCPM